MIDLITIQNIANIVTKIKQVTKTPQTFFFKTRLFEKKKRIHINRAEISFSVDGVVFIVVVVGIQLLALVR